MTTEQIKELEIFVSVLASRSGICLNPTDKELFSRAAGYLLEYQFLLKNLKK